MVPLRISGAVLVGVLAVAGCGSTSHRSSTPTTAGTPTSTSPTTSVAPVSVKRVAPPVVSTLRSCPKKEPRIATSTNREDTELVAPGPTKAVVCKYNIQNQLVGSSTLNSLTTLKLAVLLNRLNWSPPSRGDGFPSGGGGAAYNGATQVVIFYYRGTDRTVPVYIGFGFADSQFTVRNLNHAQLEVWKLIGAI